MRSAGKISLARASRRSNPIWTEASGAVADLGVLIPLAAALVVKNGVDASTVLVGVGALYIAAGLYFKLPVPVQPIKAASAIAIARGLPPETLAASGILLGLLLVVLGATGLSAAIARVFTAPVVRGLQFGLGLILLKAAWGLGLSSSVATYAAGAVLACLLILCGRHAQRIPAALLVVAAGVGYSLVVSSSAIGLELSPWRPELAPRAFDPSVMLAALVLLVIPQVPLTFGNAVVALSDLERRYFGARSARVTPNSVSLSAGVANIVAGALGGMPMCHGAGGLTAHYRSGARSQRMNLLIGGVLLALGLAFGPSAFVLLSLIPLAVLVALLTFTGVMHAWLVTDLRGYDLSVAILMGLVAAGSSNLALALAVGLPLVWARALVERRAKTPEGGSPRADCA